MDFASQASPFGVGSLNGDLQLCTDRGPLGFALTLLCKQDGRRQNHISYCPASQEWQWCHVLFTKTYDH